MNKDLALSLIVCCCIMLCLRVNAQERTTDSVQQHMLVSNMEDIFTKGIGQQSRLYNGFAYQPYNFNSTGNAYFKDSTNLVTGNVTYDGIAYKDVPLMYDIYQDLLISRLQGSVFLYKFLNEKVTGFDIFNHHFVRVSPGQATRLVPTGFYDELYNNKLKLLVKRTKSIQKGTRGFGVAIVIFSTDNKYYLKKDGVYYAVSSRSKFLDVLQDKKNELKKYLKDNNISYGNNPEQTMVALANYYDSLTK